MKKLIALSTLLCLPASAALTSQLGILDLAANGGLNPTTGLAWQNGDTYRLSFVTAGTTAATSTDIATYNAFVQNAAASSTTFSNLGTVTWNALASTTSTNVKDNTGTGSGTGESIFLMNGSSVFATNYADLWDGNAPTGPSVRINRTENNVARPNNTPIWGSWTAVWTGSGSTGGTSSGLGSASSRHGLVNAEQQFWFNRSTADSTTVLPIYALSEVLTVTDPIPEPGTLGLVGFSALIFLRRRRG